MTDAPQALSARERLSKLGPLPEPGKIWPTEVFWRDHYNWLLECGYQLRPRYHPDWAPSWKASEKKEGECEDGVVANTIVLDATRIQDGKFVVLKKLTKDVHPYETEIGLFFSQEPQVSDPRNHCVPVLDTLQVPDDENIVLIVMPLLRQNSDPSFDTVGEVVEFFRQLIEGLQFMHKNHVAHRDIMDSNIMMDATPLYPEPYHPWKLDWRRDFKGKAKNLTRTQSPVKYYYTDFGHARRYGPDNPAPLELPLFGGDKSVPEFKNYDQPQNPYLTDIYYLGNFMRMIFTEGDKYHEPYLEFDFLKPLIADMVQDDPKKRPTIDEVFTRFEELRKKLGAWKLRSRATRKNDGSSLLHWQRRIGFIIRGVPALPTPKEKKGKEVDGVKAAKGSNPPKPASTEESTNKPTSLTT